jgi:hypothetical protein
MLYDFQHSLTLTKVFFSLAPEIPWMDGAVSATALEWCDDSLVEQLQVVLDRYSTWMFR